MEFSRLLAKLLKEENLSGVMISVTQGFANDILIAELKKVANKVINID